jgi:hypothetical protein
MSTTLKSGTDNETLEEKIVRLKKISKEAKASGCIRCKNYADFARKLGLRK